MNLLMPPGKLPLERRLPIGDPVYFELLEFLYLESALLDTFELEEWLTVLTEDLVYCMPVRVTRFRGEGSEFTAHGHFDDTYRSIERRIRRLNDAAETSWSENPASRSRRFVTNVLAFRTDEELEFEVHSSVLMHRYSSDIKNPTHISAERHDIVRRTADGLKLARREIYVDHSPLPTANLGIFL